MTTEQAAKILGGHLATRRSRRYNGGSMMPIPSLDTNLPSPYESRLRCNWGKNPLLWAYHDDEYGFTPELDAIFLERLVLEINQAGLSWLTILRKREGFQQAYHGFEVDIVADYGEKDRKRLMADVSIVRNRRKINAAIVNARVFQELRGQYGSIKTWLDSQEAEFPQKTKADWVSLFKTKFLFTGPEITGEFLMSTGYLPSFHESKCWRSS
jgi:DNA-3-methyladenine glycosylase I